MSANDGFGILIFLSFFVGFVLAMLRLALNRNKQPKTTISQPIISNESEENRETEEDSQGDGLFLDDPLFPEEFDDN